MSVAFGQKLLNAQLLFSSAFQQGVDSLKEFIDITYTAKAETVPLPGTETAVFGYLAEMPLFKKWKGERTAKELSVASYSITVDDYEYEYKLTRNDVKYDKFGLLTAHPKGAGVASKRFYEDAVNLAQKNGKTTLCIDGQFFYDTDHPNGLNQNGVGTFQNLWTAMTLNSTNLQARYTYMTQLKDANGVRMGIRPNILEYGPGHIIDAPALLTLDIVAAAATTATSNAGISNVLKQLNIVPVLNNDLEDSVWYLHDTRVFKPFIILEETAPMGLQMRVDPLDPSVWDNREFLFGSEATAGFGYGLPHQSTRCEE